MEAVSTRHVLVRSIGEARPGVAVAVAHGLGLPVEKTLRAIYRAPSLLVSDVEAAVAERLSQMLGQVGLRTEVTSEPPVLPAEPPLDVAIHICDASRAYEIAEAVAGFCACDVAGALALLTTPPGVVLGGVGRSAVEALERALPKGAAEVVASDPQAARYLLIHVGESRPALERLRRMLSDRGIEAAGGGDLLADDLSFADAQAIWDSFGRTGALRIVNRDFLRFEIWLEGRMGDGDEETRHQALERLAGVPPEMAGALLDSGTVVLEGGIRPGDLAERMAAYPTSGVRVRAELTTFQAVALEVVSTAHPDRLASALAALGLPVAVPPFHTPPLPETRARIARAVLEAAGAEVYFAAPAHA